MKNKKFILKTEINNFKRLDDFFKSIQMSKSDVIFTSRSMQEELKNYTEDAIVIYRNDYGKGEPTDEMIENIRKDIPESTSRIIAIGGGSVIDIAKFLILESEGSIDEIVMNETEFKKVRDLYVIPTTCGTGSEVTNVAITELIKRKTKKGLADDKIYPDKAILVSELIKSLPYKYFATSSVDALIHAIESFLSPKSTLYSRMFSQKAIHLILQGYRKVVANGKETWSEYADEFLMASNLAGVAFGNAGCAAVHAMSYPLGGTYHIPHGEANQCMFEAVYRMYMKKDAKGRITELQEMLAQELRVETKDGLEALYTIMNQILAVKSLSEYGIKKEELEVFTKSVIEGQQRLLNNNYVELNYDDMMEIYLSIYD